VAGLEGRFFGGVTGDEDSDPPNNRDDNSGDGQPKAATNGNAGGGGGGGLELQTVVGEGMMFKEDTFLTSANLCRWIIDFHEIQVGRQVGLGSYGAVYRGKWKGVEVAIKRFIKQKLDERRMLEFRSEMAFLSELHHPNIVLFIGSLFLSRCMCIFCLYI
jgi:serine/threonine protein kinase